MNERDTRFEERRRLRSRDTSGRRGHEPVLADHRALGTDVGSAALRRGLAPSGDMAEP
eukprot:CAMPEP_0196783856 /NCGR_PEP_ID=MMETSP1104-20130614/15242_1 /TAXON_ID=33652 /ORGANISM="Cafeteria sp., Strain Caron Lab Isolate" /LENGTH=57 /DNA_ID=CAMNT_0042154123 /DNA_START=68 /DNA_END=237 /DNA_ORIENTATION=+